MLIVHIGLPKTATTFLQHWILKSAPGIRFIHRTHGPKARRLCRDVKQFAAAQDAGADARQQKLEASLGRYIEKFQKGATVVLSDENISVRAIDFWQRKGPRPAELARRFANLRDAVRHVFPDLRVVIGIRRQDRWLASRYAESSKAFDNFCQADFDRRVTEISHLGSLEPVFDWLDYHQVHSHFSKALGARNVFMFSMERLGLEPVAALRDMGVFFGGVDLAGVYEGSAAKVSEIRNRLSLSTGQDMWRLRRDDSPLSFHADLQETLLARFRESNLALNRVIPLCFS